MASQTKTIEAKKDEFRAYLEKTGVVDQLTKVLVSLYEESDKPTNALEYSYIIYIICLDLLKRT